MPTTLAYVEHSLPGADAAARADCAARLGLALEVAHRAGFAASDWRRSRAPIVTLQAYELHENHALHPDPARRAAGVRHVRATIDHAASLGVPRVLTACGFGQVACQQPFESCRAFFAELAPHAADRGVRILIEPLSPLRAPAMADPDDVQRLLDVLADRETLGTAIDVGHLLDGGHDPELVLRGWRHRVDELQLRGRCSAPPAPDAPIRDWLGALAAPPEVICLEHRDALPPDELDQTLRVLRARLAPWLVP